MPYREASKPSSPPRERPPPALVLQRWLTWSMLATASIVFALTLFFFPLAMGAEVECARHTTGAVPSCTLRDRIALGKGVQFDGALGELHVIAHHDTNEKGTTDETMLQANGFTTRIVSPAAADEAVRDYAAFVQDQQARSFHRRVSAPSGLLTWFAAGIVIGWIAALIGAIRERALRLVIDREADELVLESVAILRRAKVRAYRLSKISAVHVVPVHPTPENTDYELSIVSTDGHQRLLRADASGCQQAAMAIQASIGAP